MVIKRKDRYKEMKQTLFNDDAGRHLDYRQCSRVRIINGDAAGCTRRWGSAGATDGTGIAEALGTVLLRTVEEAQVELTTGIERHFRPEGVRRRGVAQTRAQRLIDFENVHCTRNGSRRAGERARRSRLRSAFALTHESESESAPRSLLITRVRWERSSPWKTSQHLRRVVSRGRSHLLSYR